MDIKIFDYFYISENYNFEIPEEIILDSELSDVIEKLLSGKIYRLDRYNKNLFSIVASFYKRYHKLDSKQAIETTERLFSIEKINIPANKEQIKRYRSPIKAVFIGDQNNPGIFEEQIIKELKSLPKWSTVLYAGRKGVESYTKDLAEDLGIKSILLKNVHEMLKISDIVFVFHPDILHSQENQKVMQLCYDKKIPVYLHDLKRKMVFEGDFTIL